MALSLLDFNPRSREGSDRLSSRSHERPRCYFNPRSREGSDAREHQPASRSAGDFNPRSREGSDVLAAPEISTRHISIHAPAKGATLRDLARKRRSNISIHAPAKGATGRIMLMATLTVHFNPRSREGSDDFQLAHIVRPNDFNPRSREGSDVWLRATRTLAR